MTSPALHDLDHRTGMSTSATYSVSYVRTALREAQIDLSFRFVSQLPAMDGDAFTVTVRSWDGRMVGATEAGSAVEAMAKARDIADANLDCDPSPMWWQGATVVRP